MLADSVSDIKYPKITSMLEDQIGLYLPNCREACQKLSYYLQMETYCNTVRVMIHNGIVKTLNLG